MNTYMVKMWRFLRYHKRLLCVELLNEHLADLLDHSYHIRDAVRCNDVLKAIRFWENINKKDK